MENSRFPHDVGKILRALIKFCRHQGRENLIEILENTKARIEQTEYDNWNGGTYH